MTDNYNEHQFHEIYDKDCSSCFAENMVIKKRDKQTYFRQMRETLGFTNSRALRDVNGCSPWDQNPLE